ncbi:hypothetical protein [Aliiroseovarius lamellibrachiae]|uniref:hypothetical protein n=1 Tax=Aliiroseovarius lamellibrachiae TaxID=1924933 RepID=UPI001BE0E3F0|nr:hypothetical protein [Aliiroseovarius lamellibrachiae]MBT2131949.1 hypothetical protein [Aliiroseovarius lamellibrachiae]
MKRFSQLLLICLTGLVAYFIWDQFFPAKGAWHQKLTVEIETPTGPIAATNVVGVKFRGNIKFWGSMDHSRSRLEGEAIYVNLDGKPLFVLLGGAGDLLFWTLKRTQNDIGAYSQSIRRIKRQTSPIVVPRKLWPAMVTFGDVNDPSSVQAVNPNDLSATFGPGYAITGVTVQSTDEPVTEGVVEQVLGWLGPYPELPVLPEIDPYDFSFAAKLRQGQFIRRPN